MGMHDNRCSEAGSGPHYGSVAVSLVTICDSETESMQGEFGNPAKKTVAVLR